MICSVYVVMVSAMQPEHHVMVVVRCLGHLERTTVGSSSGAGSAYCSMELASDSQASKPLVAIGQTAEQRDEWRSDLPDMPVSHPSPGRLESNPNVPTMSVIVQAVTAPCDVVLPRLERHVRPMPA